MRAGQSMRAVQPTRATPHTPATQSTRGVQPMRAALWTVRALLLAFSALDLWLLARAAQFGPGILAQTPEGGTIRLLPVQWAAAGYAWLAGLISFQLLLIAAELVLRVKLRRRSQTPPPLAGVSPTR